MKLSGQPTSHAARKFALWSVGVLALLVLFIWAIPKGADINAAVPGTRPDQAAFESERAVFAKRYRDADTEMRKSAVFSEAAERAVAIFKPTQGTLSSWRGTLKEVTTDEGGARAFVVIESELSGLTVGYRTWNNALSDISDKTAIAKGSAVYKQLIDLKPGAAVIFSGRVIGDRIRGIKEVSLTESGAMRAPEFLLRFSSITKG